MKGADKNFTVYYWPPCINFIVSTKEKEATALFTILPAGLCNLLRGTKRDKDKVNKTADYENRLSVYKLIRVINVRARRTIVADTAR